ncbi:site-specific integrase [bacterium]|nr:site-specific integrase [bacterium]
MPDRIHVWIQRFKDRPNLMLQWIDPDTGRRRSKSTKTSDMEEAEQQRSDHEYELNNDLYHDRSTLSWERFREIYITEKFGGAPPNTLSKVETVFADFNSRMKPKNLGAVTERTFSGYATKLREAGRAPASIHGNLAYLKAAFRWAQDQGLIHRMPKIIMPKLPKGTNKVKIRNASRITVEEFERLLLKAPNNGWKMLIAFAWNCGMRRCEAMAVRGRDIDLKAHTIDIPKNKARDEGATVFVTPELDALLRLMFPDGIPDGPIIHGIPKSEKEVSRDFVDKISSKAAVKGNSKDGWATLHDLRRNFGSRWMLKVPAQVLRRMMRHSDINTTLDFYADAEKAAMDVIWQKTEE